MAPGSRLITPQLVIFDCDGVLIDSELIACGVDAACLTQAGFATSAEEIRDRYVGMSAAAMFADLEARHGRSLPPRFSEILHARLAKVFEKELRPIEGMSELLAGLELPVCVASSSTHERLQHSLKLAGLYERLAPHIFSATDVTRGKPAPDLFLHAAKRMGVAPARCLVVEDSVAGVSAGVAAGMKVIGFTAGAHCSSHHAQRLLAAGAAGIAKRAADLTRFFAAA